MKLYGFWRSLATYRVRVAMALKGLHAEEISIDLLKGRQHTDEYKAVNPQGVVPALVLDEGGPPLFQSLAILEYLEETKPQPPLLPRDPRGRARVRNFLEKEMKVEESRRNLWLAHWTLQALEAIEGHLAKESETGRYCHGDELTLADICVVSQVIGALAYFNCDTSGVPTVMRVYNECMKEQAFADAHPLKHGQH